MKVTSSILQVYLNLKTKNEILVPKEKRKHSLLMKSFLSYDFCYFHKKVNHDSGLEDLLVSFILGKKKATEVAHL